MIAIIDSCQSSVGKKGLFLYCALSSMKKKKGNAVMYIKKKNAIGCCKATRRNAVGGM